MAAIRSSRRIAKELEKFQADDDGLKVQVISSDVWCIRFTGAVGTIYEGEDFALRVKFTAEYPIDSPQVVFELPAPVHPHIYSNGHICLNILGEDWSPALTVKSICLSVLSMLSSATIKALPPDNSTYTMTKDNRSNPKHTSFVYHDDSV